MTRTTHRIAALLAIGLSVIGVSCLARIHEGDHHFAEGAFPLAISAYETYVQEHPDAKDKDQKLFRIGMACFLAKDPPCDPQKGRKAWLHLFEHYPQSVYSAQAKLILSLQQELLKLQDQCSSRQEKLASMEKTLHHLEQEKQQLKNTSAAREGEIRVIKEERAALARDQEKLRAQLVQSEQRIADLKKALAGLKRIDMQRPPARHR